MVTREAYPLQAGTEKSLYHSNPTAASLKRVCHELHIASTDYLTESHIRVQLSTPPSGGNTSAPEAR